MLGKGLRVCTIGAGTGGLCLAQGLKNNDIEVEVFERNCAPTDRLQGLWGFSAHNETLNLSASSPALSGRDATTAVIAQMDGWHLALR